MLDIHAAGYLTQDPEQKQISDERVVTNLKLLVNKKIKGEEIVSSVNCSIWGAKGNAAMAYLKKGDQVTVSGWGYIRPYLRQNGEPGASIELSVSDYVLPPKPKTQSEMPF